MDLKEANFVHLPSLFCHRLFYGSTASKLLDGKTGQRAQSLKLALCQQRRPRPRREDHLSGRSAMKAPAWGLSLVWGCLVALGCVT